VDQRAVHNFMVPLSSHSDTCEIIVVYQRSMQIYKQSINLLSSAYSAVNNTVLSRTSQG